MLLQLASALTSESYFYLALQCDTFIVNSHANCVITEGKDHNKDIFRSVSSWRANQWRQQMEKVVANYQLSHIKVKLEKTLAEKHTDNHQPKWQQQPYTSFSLSPLSSLSHTHTLQRHAS